MIHVPADWLESVLRGLPERYRELYLHLYDYRFICGGWVNIDVVDSLCPEIAESNEVPDEFLQLVEPCYSTAKEIENLLAIRAIEPAVIIAERMATQIYDRFDTDAYYKVFATLFGVSKEVPQ